MVKYSLIVKKSAQKEIENLPKNYLQPILKTIKGLTTDPRPMGSEKLSGEEKYRIRKGPYRIVYSIQDKELIVWVVKVAHRKEVYR